MSTKHQVAPLMLFEFSISSDAHTSDRHGGAGSRSKVVLVRVDHNVSACIPCICSVCLARQLLVAGWSASLFLMMTNEKPLDMQVLARFSVIRLD